jgi:hypothetical protein
MNPTKKRRRTQVLQNAKKSGGSNGIDKNIPLKKKKRYL